MKVYVINVPIHASFASYIPKGYTRQGTKAPCGTATNGTLLWQYWRTNPDTDTSYFITEEDFIDNKKHIRRLALVYYP